MKDRLLLLHGALGSKCQLKELKKILAQNFEVFIMNFDGHGGVSVQNEFSIELFTNNVLSYLKENNLEKVHVFGYSMGGYVALNLALNYPGVISKIVTLGTKFNWIPESAKKEIKLLNPEVIETKVPKFAVQLAEIHGANSWKEMMNKTAKMMSDLAGGKKMTLAEFQKINHKVLIAIGGQDTMVTIEESKAVSDVMKNGSLKIMENFQHPIDRLDKQQIAETVTGFIKE